MKQTHDRSWLTGDRGPPDPAPGRFLTVESLGPKRERMKNGWLVCYEVPLARTGWMLYGPGEVPVLSSPGSPSVYVERTAEELFSPSTVASFMGAGLVNGHPDFDRHPRGLTADNARELSGGHVTNIRRSRTDDGEEVLLGDVVVTRRDFIDAILSGKREISAGYEADYETTRPGYGRQLNIVANHIALVDRGRCGPRCAIGDHAPQLAKEQIMAGSKEGGDRRRVVLDNVEFEEVQSVPRRRISDDDDDGVHVHVHMGDRAQGAVTHDEAGGGKKDEDDDSDDRITKLEKGVDALTGAVTTMSEAMKAMASDGNRRATGDAATDPPGGAKDPKDVKLTEDSAVLAASWQELISRAEVLAPGFQVPTFDAALPRAKTVDNMCGVRRSVVDRFAATDDGKGIVASILGADKLADIDCSAVATLFNAAAAMRASANNARATHDARHVPNGAVVQPQVNAVSLNAANRAFWKKQTG